MQKNNVYSNKLKAVKNDEQQSVLELHQDQHYEPVFSNHLSTVHLGVIGNPIEHSLSPHIWQMFADEFSLKINYTKIYALDTVEFKDKVLGFFASGGLALNITSPFKHEAYKIANLHTELASSCMSCNVIYNINNQLIADTTDGLGLVQDIEVNCGVELRSKKILIIGSGYVVDSILLSLFACNPTSITLYARNRERADFLKAKFGVFIPEENLITNPSYNYNNNQYDVIINTIPNSAKHNMFDKLNNLKDNALCYDLTYLLDMSFGMSDYHNYKFHQTDFLAAMHKINPNINIYTRCGLGMLVEQASIVFTSLFKLKPNTQQVINFYI